MDNKHPIHRFKQINLILLILSFFVVLCTLLYWLYYEFGSEKVIHQWEGNFRQFVFWYMIREIVILGLIIGLIYSIISAYWGNDKRLILFFALTLAIQIILTNALQISSGP